MNSYVCVLSLETTHSCVLSSIHGSFSGLSVTKSWRFFLSNSAIAWHFLLYILSHQCCGNHTKKCLLPTVALFSAVLAVVVRGHYSSLIVQPNSFVSVFKLFYFAAVVWLPERQCWGVIRSITSAQPEHPQNKSYSCQNQLCLFLNSKWYQANTRN